jgi:hypothetical protein
MTDTGIIIRFAIRDDVDKIMKSINDHWDASHILAHDRDFFLYTFGGNDNQINMVIAEEQDTGEIVGFLGYIKFSSSDSTDIATSLWKAVEGKDAILGLKILFFLLKNIKYTVHMGIGVNPKTALPIWKRMKYHVEKLEHYYRISDRDEYKIAKIMDKQILPVTDYGWDIIQLPDFNVFKSEINDSLLTEMHPYKDMHYINHRFFSHPIFHYKLYAIKENNADAVSAVFICREVERFKVKMLRVVDYIGKEIYFSYLALPLQKLIDENNYEYLDCYCCGMSEKTMNDAGFMLRKESDPNIIPNYFEPFLYENVDIYYMSNKTDNFRAFRGDIDQDQPRMYDRSLC